MWRQRKSVGTRGIECRVVHGSDAHKKGGRRPPTRAVHGGVAVAAGGGAPGAWQREGAPARAKEGGGEHQGDAWPELAGGGGAGAGLSGGRRGDAPAASKQRGRQGKRKTGYFVISEISRDLNVKQG